MRHRIALFSSADVPFPFASSLWRVVSADLIKSTYSIQTLMAAQGKKMFSAADSDVLLFLDTFSCSRMYLETAAGV